MRTLTPLTGARFAPQSREMLQERFARHGFQTPFSDCLCDLSLRIENLPAEAPTAGPPAPRDGARARCSQQADSEETVHGHSASLSHRATTSGP